MGTYKGRGGGGAALPPLNLLELCRSATLHGDVICCIIFLIFYHCKKLKILLQYNIKNLKRKHICSDFHRNMKFREE